MVRSTIHICPINRNFALDGQEKGRTPGASFSVYKLHNALQDHCVSDLAEAGDVSACNIVAIHAILLSSVITG